MSATRRCKCGRVATRWKDHDWVCDRCDRIEQGRVREDRRRRRQPQKEAWLVQMEDDDEPIS